MTLLHNGAPMTWDVWSRLSKAEKAALTVLDDLTPQLVGLEGARVEVVDARNGATRRFWVGKSTGWRPVHLEIHNKRSAGGLTAEKGYRSARVLRWR